MTAEDALALARRVHEAYNARDWDTYGDLLDEDVELVVGETVLRGREAMVRQARGSVYTLPGMRAEPFAITSTGPDCVAVEYRMGVEDEGYAVGGLACDMLQIRDGRVAQFRHYYSNADHRGIVSRTASEDEVARVVSEHAALRDVAGLVARGAPDAALFVTVLAETAQVVGAEAASLLRFERDDTATLLAAWDVDGLEPATGQREQIEDELRVLLTGVRPVRLRSDTTVAVPVVVDGRVWGASLATRRRPEPFPDDTEERIGRFTQLVGAALANAQTRADLRRLADEQVALRRVAELVARGSEPGEVLTAVAAETSRLFGGAATTVLRFHPDGSATVVAAAGGAAAVGATLPPEPGTLSGRVHETGAPARIGDDIAAPIEVDDRTWGMIAASLPALPSPPTEDLLTQFADTVATAVMSAEHRAQLKASRARIVAAADETRRRLQRDVHDGAQQRLVQTAITLQLAQQALSEGDAAAASRLAEESLTHVQRATTDLRDLVRGILPAALARGGLLAGVDSFAAGFSIPVDVDVTAKRLPPSVETTAYFIIAEALTNVAKHAQASATAVAAHVENDVLVLRVQDDGIGGATADGGSGLTGLHDRVSAANGTLRVDSPHGRGTTITAWLPLPSPAEEASSATGPS